MGRIIAIVLVGLGAWLFVDRIALRPGVGTRIEGRQVILDSRDFTHRFRRVGSHAETYMLFGGDATQRSNSPIHAILSGLPIETARAIARDYPDFHMCRSPGADQAKRSIEHLSFVAENHSALANLESALSLFRERLHAGGERTCLRVAGARLTYDSSTVKESGEDFTEGLRRALAQSELMLAEEVEVIDCQLALR